MESLTKNRSEAEKEAVENAMAELGKLIDEILENPENADKAKEALNELDEIAKDIPKDLQKVTKAIARSSIASAEKEAAKELAEINQDLGTDVASAFNAHIIITQYFDLESDGTEK